MNRKGLTVFELLVALGLFSVVVLAGAPSLRSLFARLEMHTALRAVSAGLSAARYQAIADNQPVRVEVVPGRLLLCRDEGSGWRPVRSFALSGKIAIRANSLPVFSPLGNVAPLCTITLETRQRTCRVVVSMYGRLKIYSGG